MTSDEISFFEFKRTALGKGVDKMLSSPLDIIKADDLLASLESTNNSVRMRVTDNGREIEKEKNKKRIRKEMNCSLESHTFNNGFRKAVDSAARRIHTLIAKSRLAM